MNIQKKVFIFLTCLIFIIISLQYLNILFFVIPLLVFLFLSDIVKTKFLVQTIIVGFVVLSSDLNQINRTYLVIFFTVLLCIYLVKKNGLEIKLYEKLPKLISGFLIFVIVVMFSSSLASDSVSTGVTQVIRQSFFFFVFYLLYNLNSFESIKNILASLFVIGIILSLGILYQFIYSGYSLIWFSNFSGTRFGGIISNVNSSGGIINISITIGFVIFLLNRKIKRSHQIIFLMLLCMMFFSLLLTNSRASIAAFFVSIFFLLYNLFPKSRKFLIIFPISIILILIFLPSLNEYLVYFFRLENLYANREYFWQLAIAIFRDNWFSGVGPGQFSNHIYDSIPYLIGSWAETQISGLIKEGAGTGHAHNFYLFLASELGIWGLIIGIYFQVIFIYLSLKILRYKEKMSFEICTISLAIIGIGLGLLLRSFFESTGYITYGWISRDLPFWLMLIILLRILGKLEKDFKLE